MQTNTSTCAAGYAFVDNLERRGKGGCDQAVAGTGRSLFLIKVKGVRFDSGAPVMDNSFRVPDESVSSDFGAKRSPRYWYHIPGLGEFLARS